MPKHISPALVETVGKRIKEYCEGHGLNYMRVTLHGGEPLLLGEKKLEALIHSLRSETKGITLKIGMQTNGVLLNEKIIDCLRKNDVYVGISLDGDEEANSKRVDFNGWPTFERAVNGFVMMQKLAPKNLIGILSVINLDSSAKNTISFLCELKPMQLDLLLPFETYDSLGKNRAEWANRLSSWLDEAFETWFVNKNFNHTKIRIFEDVLQSSVTNQPKTDWFGVRNISYLVVGTNGDIDVLDHLKVIGQNSINHRSTYKNIIDDSLETAEFTANGMLDKFQARKMPDGCMGCEWKMKCYGGYLPHRYSSANNFNNPSVACEAIKKMYVVSEGIMDKVIVRQ